MLPCREKHLGAKPLEFILQYSDLEMFLMLGWQTAFISLPSHTYLSFDAYLIINLPVFTLLRNSSPFIWALSTVKTECILCLNTEAAATALLKRCSRLRLLYRHGASLSPYRGNCVGTVIMTCTFHNVLTDRWRWVIKISSHAIQLNSQINVNDVLLF